jgi:predicted lipoprotein
VNGIPPKRLGRPAYVAAACAVATFGVFGACTTENPRENYGFAKAPGSGGNVPSSGGSDGRGGSLGSGAEGGDATDAGAGGTGAPGSGGSGSLGGSTNGTAATGNSANEGGNGAEGSTAGYTNGEGGEAGRGEPPPPPHDCGAPPVSTEPFTREALRAAASDCAVYQYCRFEATALELAEKVNVHAEARSEESLIAAQNAWRAAMARFQNVEMFQFGPLASRAESAGRDIYQGQAIRDLIYSWPVTARCRVEEQVATEKYKTQGFDSVFISARGLYALEYLLFYPGNDTACGATTPTGRAYAALDAEELANHKLDYAVALSADVQARTSGLIELWKPEGGNFRQTFVTASGYPDPQEALNILAWALVYVEREVKDWKLGIPAGYTTMHPVTEPETPYARVGSENIRENLRGFQSLFQGCGENGEGLGFDDWLMEADHPELATEMLSALANARAAAEAFPPLDTATPEQLETLYRAVKALTDPLKSDLFGTGSSLNLKLPDGIASDTD